MNRYERAGRKVRAALDAQPPGPERLARVEARLFDGAAPPRRSRAPLLAGLALAGTAATAGVLLWPAAPVTFSVAREGAGSPGVEVVATRDEKVLAFSEGTTVAVRPSTRARVVRTTRDGAELRLEGGALAASVVPRPRARWVFLAGPYRVQVTGTRFELSWSAEVDGLGIAMHEGSVVVSGGALAEPRQLRAGERLAVSVSGGVRLGRVAEVAPDSAGAPGKPADAPRAEGPAVTPSGPGAEPGAPEVPPRRTRPAAPAPRPAELVVPASAMGSPAGPRFAAADRVRLSGDARAAARLFEAVARDFPRDRLAGLSWYAAGRLQLVQLGDARAALPALRRACAAALPAPLDEDCQQHLVDALAAVGDHAGCARERTRYLAAFPRGTHAEAVARACDGER